MAKFDANSLATGAVLGLVGGLALSRLAGGPGTTKVEKTLNVSKQNRDNQIMDSIREQFTLTEATLRGIQYDFLSQMKKGLAGEKSSMKMLPSFVDTMPTGKEEGIYYGLDLGGSNFRIIEIEIKKGSIKVLKEVKEVIPDCAMIGDQDDLFGYIASKVVQAVPAGENPCLGFTFSFPCTQTAINGATLIEWTKGFTTAGVVGHNVAELLEKYLAQQGRKDIKVAAVCNDTVGTLIQKAFTKQDAGIGVILGTGSNACYVEQKRNIIKTEGYSNAEGMMIINMEWGGFGSGEDDHGHLPLTAFDVKVDKDSAHPGKQLFEKMMSGLYFSRVIQNVLFYLSQCSVLSCNTLLSSNDALTGASVSAILGDDSENLEKCEKILKKELFWATTVYERKIIQEVCGLVRTRAARLGGMAMATVAAHMGRTGSDLLIAIDGSVYEHVPQFKAIIEDTIDELFSARRCPGSKIHTELAQDGSGQGAALIAALYAKK